MSRRADIDTDLIAIRYAAGESSEVIAESLGCAVRTVFLRLRKAGVSSRPQGKAAKPSGERSATWRGPGVSYVQLHRRVANVRGRPKECTQCGTTRPDAHYDWANLTGNYEDVNDYARMCRSCHIRFDRPWVGRPREAGRFI